MPIKLSTTILERLWDKVDVKDSVEECWPWTDHTTRRGYGMLHVGYDERYRSRKRSVPSLVYETTIGPLPYKQEPDHLCRYTTCCNPWHLEAVTHKENEARKPKVAHCPQGHPYEGDNLYITKRGWRQCNTCMRERALARYRSRRDAATYVEITSQQP